MKKPLLTLLLLWGVFFHSSAQSLPGDSFVFGPMFSPVYNNTVRVWMVTRNNTGSGDALSLSVTASGASATNLPGKVYNSDDRLGYTLRSFEYTNLEEGETYTATLLRNGTATERTSTIKNDQRVVDDFEFLSGGCARIYDLSRCIDQPESRTHKNGDPAMFNVMAREESDMMVWLGDATYLLGLQHADGQCPDGVDDWANKDRAFDRYRFYRQFHDQLTQAMPQLSIPDNHDLGPNEFNKTLPTLNEMKEIFMDWWPNPEYQRTSEGQGLFSSYAYKDVEYFLTDNRSFRDGTRQHFGPEQMQWLKEALAASDASFKIIVSATPTFQKDCGGRNLCATQQGQELLNFIREQNIDGVLSFGADIHEQKFMFRSGDDTNYPLYDVISGNLNSDVGDGNYNVNYESNFILTGVKQTYLRVNVFGDTDDRRLKVEYVDKDGQPYFQSIIHEDMLTSQDTDASKLALRFNNTLDDASPVAHGVQGTNISYGPDHDGVASRALQFSENTTVTLPASPALQLHDRAFSFSYLIKPGEIAAPGATILSNGTANSGVTFGLDPEGRLTYTNHAAQRTYTSQTRLSSGKWSYVTYKYDNVQRRLTLYYDGRLLQSWSNVASPTRSEAEVTLGRSFEGKNFKGLLDDVSLSGRLISDAAISDGVDIKTNRGDVLKISGSPQMLIPDNQINPTLRGNFTIEFWGKLTASPGTNAKILASNGRVADNTTGISFEFPDTKKLNVVVGTNQSGWNIIADQGTPWQVGEWNHIVLSATRGGTMVYYQNGEKIGEAPFAGYVENSFGLGLGYSPFYNGAVSAELDELRIWDRALTEAEVAKHRHYPLRGDEAGLAFYYDFSPFTSNSVRSNGAKPHEIVLNGGELGSGTSPVANLPTDFRDAVTANWSVRNDNSNGLYLADKINDYGSNLVIGRQAGTQISPVTAPDASEWKYLNSPWLVNPLFLDRGTLLVDLANTFANPNDARVTATEYVLLKGDPEQELTVVTQGTKQGNLVRFEETVLDSTVLYLAWKNNAPSTGGTFPIARGSEWKYNDRGTDLGSAWRTLPYDDSDWASGNAILGYGDGRETTTLDFGGDAANKHTTYYLRYAFEVDQAADFGPLVFDILHDDGAVVYVNGQEAFRSNMPDGDITAATFAVVAQAGDDEILYRRFRTETRLREGTNVIAVELHQADLTSSDLGFDMEVGAEPASGSATFPVEKESEWSYLDTGESLDQVPWTETAYSVQNWPKGDGALGYGDPVNTEVSFGPDDRNKYLTTYFVRNINVNVADLADRVEFGLLRDDGAVVYVNGAEVFRDNMPEGAITYRTGASRTIAEGEETVYNTRTFPKSIFREGENRIAVEIHNRDAISSDLRFDLFVKEAGDAPPPVACEDDHIGCFQSIRPTDQTDRLIISEDHRFQLLFKQGDAYTTGGNVPGNHDFTAYVPTNGNSERGHLSVNHENTPGGVSIVDVRYEPGPSHWTVDASRPVDFYNNDLVTTSRNCSGGITPWGTVVTSEESTTGGDTNGDGYEDVGWLVELDPVTSRVVDHDNDGRADKLWAMGRMNHENVVVAPDRSTAYYGEDGGTQCVYKFVADTPGDLSAGQVYVLVLDAPLSNDEPGASTARWVPVPNATQADRNNLNTVAAALGGTNFNGVEDCDISPLDGKVYFSSKGKGRVYRFQDDGTTVSGFETFLGGQSYPISTDGGTVNEPWGFGNDNLVFDDKGNLWVCQDGGKNYIWTVGSDHTQESPRVSLFASMPAGSEPTGLTFTPDYRFGFFSVQHPSGNNAAQPDATGSSIRFDASASVVFARRENLGTAATIADEGARSIMGSDGASVFGSSVVLYPNPTRGEVTAKINREAGQSVRISVYDVMGRKLTAVPEQQTTGRAQSVEIDLSPIVKDHPDHRVFIMQVQVGEKIGNYKMMIQE